MIKKLFNLFGHKHDSFAFPTGEQPIPTYTIICNPTLFTIRRPAIGEKFSELMRKKYLDYTLGYKTGHKYGVKEGKKELIEKIKTRDYGTTSIEEAIILSRMMGKILKEDYEK